MNIGIFASTPAQIHFYNAIITKLKEHGHKTMVLIRDDKETIGVANELGLEYVIYSNLSSSKIAKIISLPWDILNSYRIFYKFKPELITGFGVYDSFSSALLGTKCIEFADSEPRINKLSYSVLFKLYMPFVNTVITPESFMDNLGDKQIRIESFKELAYLHPNYYKSDEGIKKILGLEREDEYILLRFNSFDAMHDVGISGFSNDDKIRLVFELKKYAKVFISSEGELPSEIKDYRIKIPMSKIHDALYYAKLLIADTGTMVTEAACLGTPAIILHPRVKKYGNFAELEKKYELIFGYDHSTSQIIENAIRLALDQNIKDKWNAKRQKLINDKIDITAFMVWFIENYPHSIKIMRNNPNYQNNFA